MKTGDHIPFVADGGARIRETLSGSPVMSVWSHRPQFSHWALFTAAYVLGCGFAKALVIVPGSSVAFWPPGGLLMATLMVTPVPSWPWWILGGALAESFGQLVWFSSGLPIGFLIIAGNALEAMAGAWLINRVCGRPVRLETLREVLAFVVLGAGLAPIISATVGSATLAWFGIKSQTFLATWPLWWTGDATGILVVAPLTLVVVQNWRGMAQLWAGRWIEVSFVGLTFLGVAALSLGGYLPFAYIVMPPLLWAAVRFDFKGAAILLILLALITAVFTLSGASEFAGDAESQRHKQIMLHLFLAVSALSALVVAAISREHQQALITLRENERDLSRLVDMVPSHIWRLTPDGRPTFFNKRAIDYFGLNAGGAEKPGASPLVETIKTIAHPEDADELAATLGRCVANGESFSMRYRLRRADGVYRWMSGRAEPVRGESGAIVQWVGLTHDIDDQVRLYRELEEREARIRRLVDSDVIGIVFWDLDGGIIDANEAFLRMVQYDREELKAGLDWFAMTPPEWQEVHAREEAAELAATGKMQAREKEYFRKDGSRVPVLIGAACFEGQPTRGVAYILDLTERKRMESALRDRERELSQLVDMVPVHIRRLTPQGEPTFFNKRLLDFFGFGDVSELDKQGMSRLVTAMQTLVHPDDSVHLLETARHSFASGEPFSLKYRMRRADGAYRWVDTRAEPLRNQGGEIVQWYVVSLDIDDEMRAQEALRRSERELQQLIDAVPAMIWSTTPQGATTYLNKRFSDVTGAVVKDLYSPDGSPAPLSVAHPDDLAASTQVRSRAFAAGTPYVLHYRQIRRDGTYRWTETRGEPLRDDTGAIIQWYGVSVDIDDQIKAQEALRQRERELSQLVNMVPVYIRRLTPEGEPTFFNKRLTDFIGMDLAQIGTPGTSRLPAAVEDFVHPDESAALLASIRHSVATGEGYAKKYRMRRADGVYRWLETRAEPVRHQDGTIAQWYVVSIDVDDEVRAQQAEEALRETSDKLAKATNAASLAELSASIAHEVNQPLAAIVANSHACQRWLSAEPANLDRAKVTIERIIRDANSASDVVGRIRALFRQSVEPRSSTTLSSVVTEARDLMAEEAARRRIRMDVDIESGLPHVAFDRVQVQQVLINLIRNGMDAMDATPGDRVLVMRVRPVNGVIQTEISDGGDGIEFPDKIFEPFFTTKENGMGMGLAICRSIVESHGGRLWAEKNEPRGSRFIFTLPVEVKTAQR